MKFTQGPLYCTFAGNLMVIHGDPGLSVRIKSKSMVVEVQPVSLANEISQLLFWVRT